MAESRESREKAKALAAEISKKPTIIKGELPQKDWEPGKHMGQEHIKSFTPRPERVIRPDRALADIQKSNALISLAVYHMLVPQEVKAMSAIRLYEQVLGQDTLSRVYVLPSPIFRVEPAFYSRNPGWWNQWGSILHAMPLTFFHDFGSWMETNDYLVKRDTNPRLWQTRWASTKFRSPDFMSEDEITVWFALPFHHKGMSDVVFDKNTDLPVILWVSRYSDVLEEFMKKSFDIKE